MCSREDKVLFFGLGNPILSDDAVGIRAVELMREKVGEIDGYVFQTGSIGGFRIVDVMSGFKKVVFVDAIQGDTPGKFYRLPMSTLSKSFHLTSPHTVNLYTAIELGRKMGAVMPDEVRVYVMEVLNCMCFGEGLSKPVARNLEPFVDFIIKEEIYANKAG